MPGPRPKLRLCLCIRMCVSRVSLCVCVCVWLRARRLYSRIVRNLAELPDEFPSAVRETKPADNPRRDLPERAGPLPENRGGRGGGGENGVPYAEQARNAQGRLSYDARARPSPLPPRRRSRAREREARTASRRKGNRPCRVPLTHHLPRVRRASLINGERGARLTSCLSPARSNEHRYLEFSNPRILSPITESHHREEKNVDGQKVKRSLPPLRSSPSHHAVPPPRVCRRASRRLLPNHPSSCAPLLSLFSDDSR